MTVIIPSYEPDIRLLGLVEKIMDICKYNIIIIDDGSGTKYSAIFKAARDMGCTLLTHDRNMGKGMALKTGFKHIIDSGSKDDVVCADSDGQHLPQDIIKIANAISKYSNHIILGSRHFKGNIPLRSRFGNTLTRVIFNLSTGIKIRDTQTGLRGYSHNMLDWLCSVEGERFEYEMNMLLEAKNNGYLFHEIEIDTVYHNNNQSSHFKAFTDSIKVYLPILKFSTSSLLSAVIDLTLLFILKYLTSDLLIAVAGARICSSTFNYVINNSYVFSKKEKTIKSLPKYFLLVFIILLGNYNLIRIFNEVIGIPLLLSKIITEGLLFILSFWAQRKFVFNTTFS